MKSISNRLITMLMLLSMAIISHASSLTIAAIDMGVGLQDQDDTGLNAEIRKSIFDETKTESEIRILPFNRALLNFSERKVACLWPFERALFEKMMGSDFSLIESESVFESTQHILTPFDKPAIKQLEELYGFRLGISIGSNMADTLQGHGAELVPIQKQISKVLMLNGGRLDAIIGWVPEMLVTFQAAGVNNPTYDSSFVLNTSGNRVLCHNTPETQTLISELDQSIQLFKTSAEFMAIATHYNAESVLMD